jgi:hypothetical protein
MANFKAGLLQGCSAALPYVKHMFIYYKDKSMLTYTSETALRKDAFNDS